MFEKVKEVPLPIGTVSPWPSNLAVCWLDTRNITYVAVIQLNNVLVGNWDNRIESEVKWDIIKPTGPASSERMADVTTIAIVQPNAKNFPILIVGSSRFIQIYEVKKVTQKPLYSVDLGVVLSDHKYDFAKHIGAYCRGISCNDNLLLIGTYTGDIVVAMCNGETNFVCQDNLKEHKSPVTDIATCRYDEITVSGDSHGKLVIWKKTVKGVSCRIETGLNINVVNVLRKQAIIGTLQGMVRFYSVTTGELMCQMNAHSRPVSSISVAPESAYVLSASEDGSIVVSKLHTRKPHAYQVEYRWSHCDSLSPLFGAQFTNGRGSSIATSSYDSSFLVMYRIMKKTIAS